jgi:hypothetical protein
MRDKQKFGEIGGKNMKLECKHGIKGKDWGDIYFECNACYDKVCRENRQRTRCAT